jgi:hypothetical protein
MSEIFWNTIDGKVQELNYCHIGWMLASLYLLCCNPTMDKLSVMLHKNLVTIRKHVWEFIGHLAALDMVREHGTYPWLTWTDG